MPTWCNQLSIYDMDTCSSMRVRALRSRREPCSECVLCCAFHVHVGLAGAGSCGAGVLRAHRRASVRSCVCVCLCGCMGVRVCVCARKWRARARVCDGLHLCWFQMWVKFSPSQSRYARVAPVSLSGFAWSIRWRAFCTRARACVRACEMAARTVAHCRLRRQLRGIFRGLLRKT